MESELQRTRAHYQLKLATLERQNRLLSLEQPNLIASFGGGGSALNQGERARLLEQIAYVESEREQAIREANVLRLENRMLCRYNKSNSISRIESNIIELMEQAYSDMRVKGLFAMKKASEKAQRAMESEGRGQAVIGALEGVIVEIERVVALDKSMEGVLGEVTEGVLAVGRMRGEGYTEQGGVRIMERIREIICREIERVVSKAEEKGRDQIEEERSLEEGANELL